MPEPTKQRLARVLRENNLNEMADRAERGYYDDYESDLVAPIVTLVQDLRGRGFNELATRAMNGEWDGTLEEGRAWYEREGKDLLNGGTA